MSILHGCTTWTLRKDIEQKLDSNCTRMLRVVMNKSRKQHPTKQLLYGHLPPTCKTIQIRQTRHVEDCRRSKNEVISNVLFWSASQGWVSVRWPATTYLQQLSTNRGCSQEDLPKAMDNRDKWQGRVREIRARGTRWYIYIYIQPLHTSKMKHKFDFSVEFKRFEFRVVLLLDRLPFQG